jgi:ubiquinol-cytochrome c reductase iron-sulfur subunit
MANPPTPAANDPLDGASRRDFLLYATSALGAVGTVAALWPLVNSMNPAADTLALSTTEVDIAPVAEGQAITVMWRGKPIFIRHRTPSEIEAARAVDIKELRDPQTDAQRVQKPEWLLMVGVCTHLGCIPLGQKPTDPKGDYGGWFCPCHGSQYDTSGRIRKGPAPLNMLVPAYSFLTDTSVRIG